MDIQAELKDKGERLHDVNRQLAEINKKIGALQEEGRAIHAGGLQLKGAIDLLLEMDVKERAALAQSKTAGLILPEGVKPVIPDTLDAASVPATAPVLETAEGVIPAGEVA